MGVRGARAWRLVGVAAGLELGWHAALFAAAELPPLAPAWFPEFGPLVVNAVAALVPLAVAWRLRWWWSAALAWRRPDRSWLLLLPFLLTLVPDVVHGPRGDAGALASLAAALLVLGWSEESLSRGVVQRVLTPLGYARGAVAVGALFALGHVLSAAWFGRDAGDTAVQVVDTATFGFCFAALRWHLGTVWPLAFLHALDDWLHLSTPGGIGALRIVVDAFEIGYGVWLLHRLPPRHRRLCAGARTSQLTS